MYDKKFVLSIIHDGHPVKESGNGSNRQVAVPFGSEYILRLKNKNDRDCTAKVTIDGSPISNFGDVIISAGGTIDLERYLTGSMSSGKRFKFVSLDHPDVDDPTKSENGIIRVLFTLANKNQNVITIKPDDTWKPPDGWKPTDRFWYYEHGLNSKTSDPVKYGATTTSFTSNTSTSKGIGGLSHTTHGVNFCSTPVPGATIEGSHSNQSFAYGSIDLSNETVVMQLKMVGVHGGDVFTPAKFCSGCGYKLKPRDKYCSGCGCRI